MPDPHVAANESHKRRSHYQDMYRASSEPWDYASRGAERLRHIQIPQVLSRFSKRFNRVLDIGCSLGRLTESLSPIAETLVAFDVSEEAVRKAKARVPSAHFLLAALPGLPFLPGTFDLVVAADAVNEFVPNGLRDQALRDVFLVLKPGGTALFTDYQKPLEYLAFHERISAVGFEVLDDVPLHDKLWYQFESWFKAVRRWPGIRSLLSSVTVAKALQSAARALGLESRHVLTVARKPK